MIKGVIVFLLAATILNIYAQEGEYTDGELLNPRAIWKTQLTEKESAVDDYIHLYQKYISGNRGSQCSMYPSCSNFGLKTFRETNFFNAFQLTSERLLRCGHEHQLYDLTYQGDGFRLLDYPSYTENPDSLIYEDPKRVFAYSEAKNLRDKDLQFVKKLINEEYYTEALLEINRLLFFDKRNDNELLLNKIICLRVLNREEQAIFEYETKFTDDTKKNPSLALQASLAYYDLNNYKQSFETLNRIDSLSATSDALSKKYRLQALSSANQGEWKQAQTLFIKANEQIPNQMLLEKNLKLLESATNFKPKSSSKASFLSIIPGLGYVYTGQKQTALTAFIINGLLGYATYTSIKKENYGVAALTGVFGASFYIGNILGAGKSAQRYNDRKTKQVLKSLEINNMFNY